jgi:hypothetical protein
MLEYLQGTETETEWICISSGLQALRVSKYGWEQS